MTDRTWISGEQHAIPALLERRLDDDPHSEYLDVCGAKFSAAEVESIACRVANGLAGLGVRPGDRVASLIENSAEAMLSGWGAVRGGYVAVPINTAYTGQYLRPDATVDTSRNWWYHTGDIGRIDDEGFLFFVDRKADYLRRRGENISSFEVESILMAHGALADVVVHAVPSELTEDDLKITATVKEGASLTAEELFRWAIDELPYFALPRYIEFRAELPRSPVGRVLKRELREEGVTPATWDAEAAGITYQKR